MDIKDMHYDAKRKLNKLDSQQYRGLRVPEIDWVLNEAYRLFVKMVAFPRIPSPLGFEKIQRNIDDIRPLVKTGSIAASLVSGNEYSATLPSDYWHHLKSVVIVDKGECTDVPLNMTIQQHDDLVEESPFDKASFEWRHINGFFFDGGLKMYSDGNFVPSSVTLTYIKEPAYIHNADSYVGGTYTLPNGTVLSGTQDCELPDQTHSEIVDIAVLLAAGDIMSSDYQVKLNKLSLNNLK